jgi:hypothetical protein
MVILLESMSANCRNGTECKEGNTSFSIRTVSIFDNKQVLDP